MLQSSAGKEISKEEGNNRQAPSSNVVSLLKAVWASSSECSEMTTSYRVLGLRVSDVSNLRLETVIIPS